MNASIEETIDRVERLYMKLTGARPQATPQTPIPPEADPITHVQEQLSRMLALVEEIVPAPTVRGWTPPAIAWLEDSDLVIAIDVPGVAANDLQLRITPTTLLISGQRKTPWAVAPHGIACDVALGSFERSFPLAAPVAPDKVSARLEDGVLTVRCPRGPRTQPTTTISNGS